MKLHDWSKIEREQMNPSFARHVVHTDTMTIARITIVKGGAVPEHSHHNEQVCLVSKGRLRFVLNGEEIIVGPGQALQIPPHVPHSVDALDDCECMDLFSPPREDWIRGEDRYLRGPSK